MKEDVGFVARLNNGKYISHWNSKNNTPNEPRYTRYLTGAQIYPCYSDLYSDLKKSVTIHQQDVKILTVKINVIE